MTLMEFLDNSVPEANEWVTDFMTELEIDETRLARQLLGSSLHALRDCLPSPDVEKLGAQLPLVMREHFFQGWCPGRDWTASCVDRDKFFRRLRRYCNGGGVPVEEEKAVRALCRVLDLRLPRNDLVDISAILPGEPWLTDENSIKKG